MRHQIPTLIIPHLFKGKCFVWWFCHLNLNPETKPFPQLLSLPTTSSPPLFGQGSCTASSAERPAWKTNILRPIGAPFVTVSPGISESFLDVPYPEAIFQSHSFGKIPSHGWLKVTKWMIAKSEQLNNPFHITRISVNWRSNSALQLHKFPFPVCFDCKKI